MGWFDFVGGKAADPAAYAAPAGIPSPDQKRTLALYKFDACPYCDRVLRALRRLGDLDVELRDTMREPEHRRGLIERTGRTQVPCLIIDDVPFHESADIVAWLEAYAIRGGAA